MWLKEFYYNHIEKQHALYFVLIAEICSSLMLVISKLLQSPDEFIKPMNTLQILFVRMIVTYFSTVVYLYWKKVDDAPWGPVSKRGLLLVRGILGFVGIAGLYYPLQYISVSDCLVIMFLTPSVIAIMSTIFLREKVTLLEGLGGLISLIGVGLIARPSFIFGDNIDIDHKVESADPCERLLATVSALVAVLCNSGVYILIRHMGEEVHAVQMVSYYSLVTTVLSFIGLVLIPDIHFIIPSSTKQWIYISVIGLTGFFMQFIFTIGLQKEKASKTSLMMYTQMVFGLLWEYLVWRHIPNLFSWLGIFIVLGSAFFTIYYKPSAHMTAYNPLPEVETNSTDADNNIELKDITTYNTQV